MILGESSNLTVGYLQNVLGPRVIQIMFVVGLVIYFLFALVILKQTKVMSQTIEGKYNKAIITFAWMHLIMVVLLVVLAIVIL